MKRTKIDKDEHYSEGNLDASTISYFLKQVDNLEAEPPVKHKLKVLLMELVSNILVHAQLGYGSVSVKHEGNDFVIRTSNYSEAEKINKTIAVAQELKTKENLREHYLNQLAEVSFEKQVSLGLIEIFRLSNGRMNISSSLMNDRLALHVEIRLSDGK